MRTGLPQLSLDGLSVMRVVPFRPVRNIDPVQPIGFDRDRETNRDWQTTRGAQTNGPVVDGPLLNQRLPGRLDRNQSGSAIAAVDEQSHARFDFGWLCIGRQHGLQMRAHDDAADAAMILALWHNVVDKTYP